MSLLNQLFNRGLLGTKCKTCLTLAISRIKLVQNKRDMQLKHMRKEIAQFLQTGQEAIAIIRVEHIIREQNIWAAYEILELFCEFVLARVPILESQRECPSELKEAVASIIYAAPRCSDLPDLLQIKNLFAAKYGKEFIMAASELRPDTSVNRSIIEKLSASAPSPETKLKILKQIAREHNLEWDSSNTEAELSKKHDDLLDASKKICNEAVTSPSLTKQGSNRSAASNSSHLNKPTDSNQTLQSREKIEPLTMSYNGETVTDIKNARSESFDIMVRAQTAIAAAERASAAARAAAELANIKFESLKVEGKS